MTNKFSIWFISLAAMQGLRDAAAAGMSYDMMLQAGNAEGEAKIMAAVEALVAQSKSIERVSTALDLAGVVVEGDDSLNEGGDVFQ